jgi:hypothetical protein
MPPLAHHLGEQSLATLLLLGGGSTLSLVVAIGRARLEATGARMARQLRTWRPG